MFLTWMLLAMALQSPKAAIEGVVVRAGTKEPIIGVEISILGPEGDRDLARWKRHRPVFSDDQGRFAITGLEAGTYILKAEHKIFALQEYGERATGRPGVRLDVAEGQRLQNIVFQLTPGGVVSGRVVNEKGEPVAEVSVAVQRYGYISDGRRVRTIAAAGNTDDRGQYRLYGVAPGHYQVVVNPPGSESEEVQHAGYVKTFYPASPDAASAATIEVGPGAEIPGIDFILQGRPVFRVSGRIPNPNAVLIEAYLVDFVSMDRAAQHQEGETSNGVFEINHLISGSYRIVVSAGERIAAQGFVSVSDADVENVSLTPHLPGATINGRIRFDDPAVASGAAREVVWLKATDEDQGGGDTRMVDPDYTFGFYDIAPGSYLLAVTPLPPGVYFKSARVSDMDVLGGLDITTAAPIPLEIELGSDGGRLDGIVLDKERKPMPGLEAVLVPERLADRVPNRILATDTDLNGQFVFHTVPPGSYKLFAWDKLEPNGYFDAEFVRQYETLGTPIRIVERSGSSVELKAIPAR